LQPAHDGSQATKQPFIQTPYYSQLTNIHGVSKERVHVHFIQTPYFLLAHNSTDTSTDYMKFQQLILGTTYPCMIAERVVLVLVALAIRSEDIYTLPTIEWPFSSPKNKSTCK
jgi:hypothetical protein